MPESHKEGMDPSGLVTLLGLTQAQGIQQDGNFQTADFGMSLVQIVRAIVGSEIFKQSMVAQMAAVGVGPAFDSLLLTVRTVQNVQNALLLRGVVKGGAGLSVVYGLSCCLPCD